jgi:hypothetical protein
LEFRQKSITVACGALTKKITEVKAMTKKLLYLALTMLLCGTAIFSCKNDDDDDDAAAVVSDDDDDAVESMPWEVTREDEGEPLTPQEITAFTKKITGFWKDSGYFDWVWWTSHGLSATYDTSMPDYKLWWQDTQASKLGNTITFSHTGGADNLTLRTCKVLNNAIAGYILSGDEMFRRIIISYSKGLVALSQGMEYGANDPVKYLQARAIFTHNHSYELEGGRMVTVDYDPVKQDIVESWNAHTIPNDSNPYYGEIWMRTMRSKDDVPHMFRTVPLLMDLAENAEDAEVAEWAGKALEYLVGFSKDIVDQGYQIRTKNIDGEAFIPMEDNGRVKDLASFVSFEAVFENAECNPQLTSSLIAYEDPQDVDCGTGEFRNEYEIIATARHYFNYAIVRYFHMSAISMSIVRGYNEVAEQLLAGLFDRADYWMTDEEDKLDHREWDADVASQLLASATVGLPLKSSEARLIMEMYSGSADHYVTWDKWDPWADTVPDGAFDYKPDRNGYVTPGDSESGERTYVRPTEIPYLLEYCYSPYRNPNGAELIDCDVIADPSRWGE